MALKISCLGLGKVPASTATYAIYTVPIGKAAIIGSISVTYEPSVNTRLLANIGGTAVQIAPDATYGSTTTVRFADKITLAYGDKIEVNFPSGAPASANTPFAVSGFARDV